MSGQPEIILCPAKPDDGYLIRGLLVDLGQIYPRATDQ
jgi:hypothetical protein